NSSDKPMNGSSCTTARTQSSKAFRSIPRRKTPAALISSSTPQHFSRGLCRTMITGSPGLIPLAPSDSFIRFDFASAIYLIVFPVGKQLSYKLSDPLYYIKRAFKSFNLCDERGANNRRVSIAPSFGDLFGVGNSETNGNRQLREFMHAPDQRCGLAAHIRLRARHARA